LYYYYPHEFENSNTKNNPIETNEIIDQPKEINHNIGKFWDQGDRKEIVLGKVVVIISLEYM